MSRRVLVPLKSHKTTTPKPVWNRFQPDSTNTVADTRIIKMDPYTETAVARNSILSKTAITRAFNEAVDQKYSSAVETLTVASTFIEVSDAANNERCRAMVSNLKDLIQAFEKDQREKTAVKSENYDMREKIKSSSRRSCSRSDSEEKRSFIRSKERRSSRQYRARRQSSSEDESSARVNFEAESSKMRSSGSSRSSFSVKGSTKSATPKRSHAMSGSERESSPRLETVPLHSYSNRQIETDSRQKKSQLSRSSRSRGSSDIISSEKSAHTYSDSRKRSRSRSGSETWRSKTTESSEKSADKHINSRKRSQSRSGSATRCPKTITSFKNYSDKSADNHSHSRKRSRSRSRSEKRCSKTTKSSENHHYFTNTHQKSSNNYQGAKNRYQKSAAPYYSPRSKSSKSFPYVTKNLKFIVYHFPSPHKRYRSTSPSHKNSNSYLSKSPSHKNSNSYNNNKEDKWSL